jgi:RNA polymerase sigma-70 factor, ECF subfamily
VLVQTSSPEAQALRELWAIWLREQSFLQNHARALAGRSGADVDDLTDEALLRAVSATLRGAGPRLEPRSWLKLVLDRTSVDQHRRRRRFDSAEASGVLDRLPGEGPSPERELLSREERRAAERRLSELPEPLRGAFEQRVLEGASYEAIACAQYTTASNARKRVQLARALLRSAGRRNSSAPRRRPDPRDSKRATAQIDLTLPRPSGHFAAPIATARQRNFVT